MRVNIVCRNPESDRIIPRLAVALSQATGWSINPTPVPFAQINYFWSYLEAVEFLDFKETLTAGWFTHHDTYQRGKAELWAKAAEYVDLRTLSARPYYDNLAQYGDTALVMPPLNTQKFKPDYKRIKPDIPVVGTSGWVYPGGRKGEQLFKRLANSALGKKLHLIASGQGWPVPCKMRSYAELERFYQQLDVYVCTSLVEGVGYGPLEALACGVPVVVPHSVGVFDDLPDMPGIYRYKAGDYAGMVNALQQALDCRVEKDGIVQTIIGFTIDAWVNDHKRAFRELLDPHITAESLPAPTPAIFGVYYVAFGGPSREMAHQAVSSFKEWMPDIPAALVSSEPLGPEDLWIEQPDQDIGGRIAKINIDNLAPKHWQYVLYLDADTEIVANISVLFQFLADGWELVICKNPGKYHIMSQMTRPDNHDETMRTFEVCGENVLQLNGGVFAYRRNERTKRFFELWLSEWNRYGKRDQAALHRALWQQPLKVYVLGNEWNTVTRYDEPEITAGILHYPTTARRWEGRIDGRLDSAEAWAAVK
ncbi:MAG: glycosyltransferase [Anaerolineae bacterium]|nr:glycosyltransferase [Anaerolineae bacterium]